MRRHLAYAFLAMLALPAAYVGIKSLREDAPPPGHVYILDGRHYRHATRDDLNRHVDALWSAYRKEYSELLDARTKLPGGGLIDCLKPEELRSIINSVSQSILSSNEDIPDGMPKAKHVAYREALAACTHAEMLQERLELIDDIKAASPRHLGEDPSGYYEDRSGGALCVLESRGKYTIHVGAGRGASSNSDRLSFSGALKERAIIAEAIPDDPNRTPRLVVESGIVNLTGAGDRLDGTYVRLGTLTHLGRAMCGEVPLGGEITDDAGAERFKTFMAKGVVFFRNASRDRPSPEREAMQIVDFVPEKPEDR